MHHPAIRTRPAAPRPIQIGRLTLEITQAGGERICNCEPVREVGESCYMLLVPLSGTLDYAQAGRTGSVGAGEYVLLSQMAFHEFASQPNMPLMVLRIPALELRGRLTSVDDHIGRRFGANVQMTRLLVDLLRSVTEVFADCPPPNPEALATEIFSFVALAIGAEDRGSTVDVRNARYHLRRRIFEFIEKNLGDQDLTPRKIAASSRISLSYLYSLFNDDDTTVSQFMQLRRLQRAYELLVADPRGRLTVSEIAYQVGFKNVSHFSRSFSRQFNMAPRDARRSAQEFPEPKAPPPAVEIQERLPHRPFVAHTLQASP